MYPALILGGSLALAFLLARRTAPKGFVAVPIPPPNADGSPPKNARVPAGIGLFADITKGVVLQNTVVKPHGALVPVTWEFQTGQFQGEGGGAPLPLLWVSPDRVFAAVLWTLDPATGAADAGPPGGLFAKPGDVLMALVKR